MNVIMVAAQVLIAMFGGTAFSIVRINGNQWAISVVVAVLCIPWGVCVRLFPNAWFEVGAEFFGKPFVVAYRPLSMVWGRATKKMERKKKVEEKNNTVLGDTASSDDGNYVGRGKSPAQKISVRGDVE
jgi:Ca2+-transporting ATPase